MSRSNSPNTTSGSPSDAAWRRKSVINTIEMIQAEEEKESSSVWENLQPLIYSYSPLLYVIVFFVINVVIWRELEPDWSVIDAIYFITTSLTTVGYGDFHPKSDWGRLYCVLFLFMAIGLIFPPISDAMDWALTKLEEVLIGKSEIDGNRGHDGMSRQSRKILFSLSVIFLTIITGICFMVFTHEWTFIEAFYWSVVTSLTVGYGDQSWNYDTGTLIFITCYMLVSTMSIAVAIQNFVEVSAAKREEKLRLEVEKQLDVVELLLDRMDGHLDGSTGKRVLEDVMTSSKKNGDGDGDGVHTNKNLEDVHITRDEFVLFMLRKTDVVSDASYEQWSDLFGRLDQSGDNKLTLADIRKKDELMKSSLRAGGSPQQDKMRSREKSKGWGTVSSGVWEFLGLKRNVDHNSLKSVAPDPASSGGDLNSEENV